MVSLPGEAAPGQGVGRPFGSTQLPVSAHTLDGCSGVAHTTRQIWPSQSKTWSTGLLTLAAGAAHPGTAASSAATITSTHIVLRFMWLPPPPTRGFRRLTLSSEGVAYIHDTIHGQKLTLKATPFLCLAETLMRVYDTPAGHGSPNLRIKGEEGRRFEWGGKDRRI
jgi:hypothetical protein